MSPGRPPACLSRELDAARLSETDPCESIICLGSFWPYLTHSYESHLVKGFKECNPAADYQPHISRMCDIYAGLIADRVGNRRFDWIARVLSSTEHKPESTRPLALLEDTLRERLRANSLTALFFRTESRPAMRQVGQLSGPDVLRRRIHYVAQDLFIAPSEVGGRVLLIDDILNTGATMRVYAQALKQFAGVQSVVGVNLAATRFRTGKDGRGRLQLDVSRFESLDKLHSVWVDAAGVYHEDEACASIQGSVAPKLAFLAQKRAAPCTACASMQKPKRRFWGLLHPS